MHRQHGAILDGLAEGEAALLSPGPDVTMQLATIRWRLVRDLRHYQLFKHHDVFDPFIRSADKTASLKAAAMKRRCTEIGERFLAHVSKWSSGDIANDRSAYDTDAATMICAIRAHLTREQQEIDHLLNFARVELVK